MLLAAVFGPPKRRQWHSFPNMSRIAHTRRPLLRFENSNRPTARNGPTNAQAGDDGKPSGTIPGAAPHRRKNQEAYATRIGSIRWDWSIMERDVKAIYLADERHDTQMLALRGGSWWPKRSEEGRTFEEGEEGERTIHALRLLRYSRRRNAAWASDWAYWALSHSSTRLALPHASEGSCLCLALLRAVLVAACFH